MTERVGVSIRELQRAGWEIRVDDEEATEFLASTSLHEPVERTLRIQHKTSGAIACEFKVVRGDFYLDVIQDLVSDLARLE